MNSESGPPPPNPPHQAILQNLPTHPSRRLPPSFDPGCVLIYWHPARGLSPKRLTIFHDLPVVYRRSLVALSFLQRAQVIEKVPDSFFLPDTLFLLRSAYTPLRFPITEFVRHKSVDVEENDVILDVVTFEML